MADLYQYTDYRAFLRDWLPEAKESYPALSFRYLAGRLGLDPGFLVHVFHGQKHLAERHLPAMVNLLKLGVREAEYFKRLVAFGKAKGASQTSQRFADLMELREAQVREISSREHRYYRDWYVPAIRCLLAAIEFRDDWESLAARLRPAIRPEQAKLAVELLAKLGLIERTPAGCWEPTDSHISSGDAWTGLAVQGFQRQMSELGLGSLKDIPKEEREISTLTFAIPREEFPYLREMVRDFRGKLARWAVSTTSADAVFQMNIQVFPVSRP